MCCVFHFYREVSSGHKGVVIAVLAGIGGFLLISLIAVGAFIVMWRRTKWREANTKTYFDSNSEGSADGERNQQSIDNYDHAYA